MRRNEQQTELNLETRAGLPAKWRYLLEKHPRDGWASHSDLGEHARFWLTIHRHFRITGAKITSRSADYREGRVSAETFRRQLAPVLQQFLGTLDHHHRIEDGVFFPKFMAAENRLAAGIELLEADHHIIDAEVQQMVVVANTLLQTEANNLDRLKQAGSDFADCGDRLIRLLDRHLDDEEEIVVPLF